MRFFLISFLVVLVAGFPACKGEDKKFSGVGKMIADRNRMRYEIAGELEEDKNEPDGSNQKADSAAPPSTAAAPGEGYTTQLSTNALEEKQIVIVETSSGTPLCQGVAYVNKKGDIVKIKLAN